MWREKATHPYKLYVVVGTISVTSIQLFHQEMIRPTVGTSNLILFINVSLVGIMLGGSIPLLMLM